MVPMVMLCIVMLCSYFFLWFRCFLSQLFLNIFCTLRSRKSAIDDHKVSLWLFRMAWSHVARATGAALTQPARFDIQGGATDRYGRSVRGVRSQRAGLLGLWGFPISSITGSHFSLIPGWYPKTLELGYEWLFDVIRLILISTTGLYNWPFLFWLKVWNRTM
jgi:hypothetical protein